jgi:hypothetical protein
LRGVVDEQSEVWKKYKPRKRTRRSLHDVVLARITTRITPRELR